MRAILIIISIYVCFSYNLIAQNTQNFLGIYTLTEVCTSKTFPGYSDSLDYEIEITESSVNTFDIQFYLDAHFQDTIRAIVINDSAFQISLQIFQNFDSTSISIWGEGFVQTDSIEIHYGSGGEIGLFECYCAGVRKKETGNSVQKSINPNFAVYPNPVRDILYLKINKTSTLNQSIFITIYNLKGDLIQHKRLSLSDKFEINVGSLLSGIYFLSIEAENNIEFSGYFLKE